MFTSASIIGALIDSEYNPIVLMVVFHNVRNDYSEQLFTFVGSVKILEIKSNFADFLFLIDSDGFNDGLVNCSKSLRKGFMHDVLVLDHQSIEYEESGLVISFLLHKLSVKKVVIVIERQTLHFVLSFDLVQSVNEKVLSVDDCQ